MENCDCSFHLPRSKRVSFGGACHLTRSKKLAFPFPHDHPDRQCGISELPIAVADAPKCIRLLIVDCACGFNDSVKFDQCQDSYCHQYDSETVNMKQDR